MYTAHYVGITIFGGYHLWQVATPEGKLLCEVIHPDKQEGEKQVDNLLLNLNWRFVEEELNKKAE